MNLDDVFKRLIASLPGGEWADVQRVGAIGMMREKAVHATATWTRENLPAYLKVIPTRNDSAGRNTRKLVGRPRLVRLQERLSRVREARPSGVVRLLHVEYMDGVDGLVIAMEAVRPLRDKINGSANVQLSTQVLRELRSEVVSPWIHFDICPSNTGITQLGDCVLIDVDSLYECSDEDVHVSYMACKPRFSPKIREKLVGQGELVSRELATDKHNAEVILLAAECCLGPLECSFDVEGVKKFCDEANADPGLVETWRSILLRTAEGEAPGVDDVLISLEPFATGHPGSATSFALRESEHSGGVRGSANYSAESAVRVPRSSEPDDSPVVDEFPEFDSLRRALRGERLRAEAVESYRLRLWEQARQSPEDRRWWDELLVVTLGYQRDPEAAIEVARQAVQALPNERRFERELHQLRVWLGNAS